MQRFHVDKLLPYACFVGQGQEFEKRFHKWGGYPYEAGLYVAVVRIGGLLEEMGGHAACIAAAMFVTSVLMVATPVGRQVVFHTDHAVFMMMMGNDRHCQHNHADEEQEICNVPFRFHSFLSLTGCKDRG